MSSDLTREDEERRVRMDFGAWLMVVDGEEGGLSGVGDAFAGEAGFSVIFTHLACVSRSSDAGGVGSWDAFPLMACRGLALGGRGLDKAGSLS